MQLKLKFLTQYYGVSSKAANDEVGPQIAVAEGIFVIPHYNDEMSELKGASAEGVFFDGKDYWLQQDHHTPLNSYKCYAQNLKKSDLERLTCKIFRNHFIDHQNTPNLIAQQAQEEFLEVDGFLRGKRAKNCIFGWDMTDLYHTKAQLYIDENLRIYKGFLFAKIRNPKISVLFLASQDKRISIFSFIDYNTYTNNIYRGDVVFDIHDEESHKSFIGEIDRWLSRKEINTEIKSTVEFFNTSSGVNSSLNTISDDLWAESVLCTAHRYGTQMFDQLLSNELNTMIYMTPADERRSPAFIDSLYNAISTNDDPRYKNNLIHNLNKASLSIYRDLMPINVAAVTPT